MNIIKPKKDPLLNRSIPEILLRLLLSCIKGTPENLQKEMEKQKQY